MRLNDAVIGLVLLLFAAAMTAYTTTFPEMPGQNYGPALFPVIIGAGLAACGLLLVIKGLRDRATVPWLRWGAWIAVPRQRITVALVPVALLFYILTADVLGFIPCAILILVVLTLRLGASRLAAGVTALLATLLIHGFFTKVLLVPLPWGLLEAVAW